MGTVNPTHPPTARELEVLRLYARGYSTASIGRRLFIAHSTVKNTLYNIGLKLNTASPREAVYEVFIRPLLDELGRDEL